MAKDLPYFKFFCSEWSDGDITLEDYEVQGIFINICSYYWSNKCEVEVVKLKKRFKDCSDKIDLMIKEDLIKVENGNVIINFLIEQLSERDYLSRQNRINAKKRWSVKPSIDKDLCDGNANASDSHSESDAIKKREEEKRREEKRKEENLKRKISLIPTIDIVVEYLEKEKKYSPKLSKAIAEVFYSFYEQKNWMVGKNKMTKWKSALGRSLSEHSRWDSMDRIIKANKSDDDYEVKMVR